MKKLNFAPKIMAPRRREGSFFSGFRKTGCRYEKKDSYFFSLFPSGAERKRPLSGSIYIIKN